MEMWINPSPGQFYDQVQFNLRFVFPSDKNQNLNKP